MLWRGAVCSFWERPLGALSLLGVFCRNPFIKNMSNVGVKHALSLVVG